jgi:hypothetical protein
MQPSGKQQSLSTVQCPDQRHAGATPPPLSVGVCDQVAGPPSSGFVQSLGMSGVPVISEQNSVVSVAENMYLQQPSTPVVGHVPDANVNPGWATHAVLARSRNDAPP